MLTVLLLLLLFDCIALTIVILLQSGKGGGLAAGFGGAGTGMEMMGSRQTATFLHNATRWLGGAFLVICFAISILTVRGSRPRSLIESELPSAQQEAEPAETGTPGDLQEILGDPDGTPSNEGSDAPSGAAGSGSAAPGSPVSPPEE